MAHRDEILAYAAELLDLDAWPDYGPMGMQVIGSDEVQKVVCAVSPPASSSTERQPREHNSWSCTMGSCSTRTAA
jgi:hypothetical protein